MGYVAADDYEGALDVLRYLRGRGRKRIATITGPQDTSGGIRRLDAYRADQGHDLDESLVAYGDYSRESGAKAMRELLNRVPDVDAVFAANDLMALGAIDVLKEAGRRIPDDVAVAGFDKRSHRASWPDPTGPPTATILRP